jgi:hypothetical protein
MYTPFNDEIQIRIRINHFPFVCCVNDTLDSKEKEKKNSSSSIANERTGEKKKKKEKSNVRTAETWVIR